MKRAWIVQGGWPGHQPRETAETMAGWLAKEGFDVETADTLEAFLDREKLLATDLIIPHWTMGSLAPEALRNLLEAVKQGAGIGGLHGGMGDAFRSEPDYQYMVGGQFVAHPGGDAVTYRVRISDPGHPVTEGVSDFEVTSELYHMHVDPSVRVLAHTLIGDGVEMPVTWTKTFGAGRVFYCSLGHSPDVLKIEEVRRLVTGGMAWAAR